MKRSWKAWVLSVIIVFTSSLFLNSCNANKNSTEPETTNEPQNLFYIGYYQEDPARNPEDPTAGVLFLCLPEGDGSFQGQFLFSFVGCTGGMDLGMVQGNKTGTSLSGNWDGDVDGNAIGGDFNGSSSSGEVYSGSWTNSSGKVHVQVGECEYYVAPAGTWTLYGPGKQDFNLSAQSGNPPTFSWDPVNQADYYLIGVFDPESACSQYNFSTTLMWLGATQKTAVTYGEGYPGVLEISPDKPLGSGKTYVVLVAAVSGDATSGTIPANGIIAISRESFQQP